MQFERTRKYSVLDERPDLKSKCCRRRLSARPRRRQLEKTRTNKDLNQRPDLKSKC